MTRHVPTLLFLLAAFSIVPAAANDLVLDPRTGTLVVMGSPDLSGPGADFKSLTGNLPVPTLLAVYTDDGQVSQSCSLPLNATVQLQNAGTTYVTVTVNSSQLVTTAQTDKFAATTGPDGYVAFNLVSNTPPGTGILVPACAGFPTSLTTDQYLRISSDALQPGVIPQQVLDGGDGGDPPIPIVGNSLQLLAPDGGKFVCSSNEATLSGLGKATHLDKARIGHTPDPFLYLEGIGNWTITAYPQRMTIAPSRSGPLKFSVPPPLSFECSGGAHLSVMQGNKLAPAKPWEFVVDWSPGWFSGRRSLALACGTCRLRLVVKKSSK